jgi:CxxC motif-containing protein (DUF1111 family)
MYALKPCSGPPGLALVLLLAFAAEATGGDLYARPDLSMADAARVVATTTPAVDFSQAEPFEAMQAGASTSVDAVNSKAFSHVSDNLGPKDRDRFLLGNALFRKLWVSSPSSTQASDGLGPLFNARSCESCHIGDGRGHPPDEAGDATSFLVRIARPAVTEAERQALLAHDLLNFPDAVYGHQLQDRAVSGLAAEGHADVSYTESTVLLAGGETVHLRKPTLRVAGLAYGPMGAQTSLSGRIAQPMIGLGLIEAIHPADLERLADPDDRDSDGISGRLSQVKGDDGRPVAGRFGWKAQNATVRQQTAAAFSSDIGISTSASPDPYGDCTAEQRACRLQATGVQPGLGKEEAPDPVLDLVTLYSENLAVPARRKASFPETLKGKKLFYEAGCTSCHSPKFVTRRDAANPAQAFQLIWPYSDFLLHDMGPDLADGQQVGTATGSEWRTPPLWGIGLTKTVSGDSYYLHDGRARSLSEAIVWHDGEAKKARNHFVNMQQEDRNSLIQFLESL